MGLPDDDRRALRTRLTPAGAGAVDVVADAVTEDEELREIVVDAQGDVVAFTDRRALFVADGTAEVVPVDYDAIELRRRDSGLAIDVLIEGGRLILDVARGTFARLAVVGTGAPPARASWLPVITPPPRPAPAPPLPPGPSPSPSLAPLLPSTPPAPPGPSRTGPVPPPAPAATSTAPAPTAPAPTAPPAPPPPGLPPAGWHPDPAGRHWWRWWDGVDWTEHVADGGSPYVDPLPPRA
jgi:hypothetical protein